MGHVASIAIDKPFENLRSFVVVSLLKSSYTDFENLNGTLVLKVRFRPFGIGG
jgi:hypothetical protein